MWELDHKEDWAPRIDAFGLWCWRRLLRIPWIARRSNQSVLNKVSGECSLEGLMLKLKLQYFGHELIHLKRPWCWERLKVGEEGDDRGWDGWMTSPTQRTLIWVSSASWWWTGKPGVLQSMGLQRVRQDWATELIWIESMKYLGDYYVFGILWWKIHSYEMKLSMNTSLLYVSDFKISYLA